MVLSAIAFDFAARGARVRLDRRRLPLRVVYLRKDRQYSANGNAPFRFSAAALPVRDGAEAVEPVEHGALPCLPVGEGAEQAPAVSARGVDVQRGLDAVPFQGVVVGRAV